MTAEEILARAIHKRHLLQTNHQGVYERFHDGDGSEFHVEKVQDVGPILDYNQKLRNADDGWNADRSGRRVASIPMVLYHQWLEEGFDALEPGNEAELRRRLNSPEWAKLRTSEGSV